MVLMFENTIKYNTMHHHKIINTMITYQLLILFLSWLEGELAILKVANIRYNCDVMTVWQSHNLFAHFRSKQQQFSQVQFLD